MLYWANLGCLATKVIISAQDKTKEMAAKCLLVWQGSSKDESGAQRIMPTKIISKPSSQFSGVKMYLFKDTLIWKTSLNMNKDRSMVKTVHKAPVPKMRVKIIKPVMVQSSQDVMKMNLKCFSKIRKFNLLYSTPKKEKRPILTQFFNALWLFFTQLISMICTIPDSGGKGLSIKNVSAKSKNLTHPIVCV